MFLLKTNEMIPEELRSSEAEVQETFSGHENTTPAATTVNDTVCNH